MGGGGGEEEEDFMNTFSSEKIIWLPLRLEIIFWLPE